MRGPVGDSRRELVVGAALIAGVAAAKLVPAATWGVIADEALYWVWSRRLAAGDLGHPPAIAWAIAATPGDGALSVRLGAVLCTLAGLAALPVVRDRALWALWWCGLPILTLLTLFATPDAPLLAGWVVGLAAAWRGGRWWLVAGLAAGLAFEARLSGGLLYPLLLVATAREDARTPWPWAGALIVGVLAATNLVWNAANDWVSFGFQLGHGFVAPGALGPLDLALGQLGLATPLVVGVGGWWLVATAPDAVRLRGDRAARIAWWTAAPPLLLLAVAATRAPFEASQAAPAWVSIGVGLACAARFERAAWVAAWTGALVSLALVIHGFRPLLPLPDDPGARLEEGRVLADAARSWAFPVGVSHAERAPAGARAIVTERYQDAALISYETGLSAARLRGCGRADPYDLWPQAHPTGALLIRPADLGAPECAPEAELTGTVVGRDRWGRVVGAWQAWEIP